MQRSYCIPFTFYILISQSSIPIINAPTPGTTVAKKLNQGTTPQPGGNRLRSPFWFLFGEAKRNRKKLIKFFL